MIPTKDERFIEIDPTAFERTIVTMGIDETTFALLSEHGRVSPVPIGATVADAAWNRTDLVVVGIDLDPRSAGAGLAAPARSAQLISVVTNLKRAGARGVERVVLESTSAIQPHSDVLRDLCDLHLGAEALQRSHDRPLSPPAAALLRVHNDRVARAKRHL